MPSTGNEQVLRPFNFSQTESLFTRDGENLIDTYIPIYFSVRLSLYDL